MIEMKAIRYIVISLILFSFLSILSLCEKCQLSVQENTRQFEVDRCWYGSKIKSSIKHQFTRQSMMEQELWLTVSRFDVGFTRTFHLNQTNHHLNEQLKTQFIWDIMDYLLPGKQYYLKNQLSYAQRVIPRPRLSTSTRLPLISKFNQKQQENENIQKINLLLE